MEGILALVLGVLTTGILAVNGYFKFQGDANITLIPEDMKNVSLQKKDGQYHLSFELPLINKGKQNGMLMEIFAQPAYLGKIMEKVVVVPRFRLKTNMRPDWYWEAVIIKKNTAHILEGSVIIQFIGESGNLIDELPKFTLVLHTKTIGRTPIQLSVTELNFDLKEILESGDCH